MGKGKLKGSFYYLFGSCLFSYYIPPFYKSKKSAQRALYPFARCCLYQFEIISKGYKNLFLFMITHLDTNVNI